MGVSSNDAYDRNVQKKKKVSGHYEKSSNWIRFSTHRGLETFITRNQMSINEGFLPLRQV